MADHAVGTDAAIGTIALQAAPVTALPEIDVGFHGPELEIASQLQVELAQTDGGAAASLTQPRPRGGARLAVGVPEAQTLAAAGAQRKPAIEHDQVVAASGPIELGPQGDRPQINEEQLRV